MLKISISGADRIKSLGSRIQIALKSSLSLAPVRQDIQRITADSNRRSFNNESSPDGQSWKPRKQQRGRKIVNRKLLVKSGAMRDSLLSPQIRIENFGARLIINYTGKNSFLIPIHNFGTRTIPSRPIGLALDSIAQEEINRIAFERITTEFAKRLREK